MWNLHSLPEYYKSKTPLQGNYEANLLKKKTCWQGTTSQGKHALGAFGPDRMACVVGWNYFDGCLHLFCRCFTALGVKRVVLRCQNGAEKVPTTTKMGPKGCHREPWNIPKHPLGNRVGKVRKKAGLLIYSPVPFSIKIRRNPIPQINKNTIVKKHGVRCHGLPKRR